MTRSTNRDKSPTRSRFSCTTCGRNGPMRVRLNGREPSQLWCCMGPGDPWLPGQTAADRDTFPDRMIATCRTIEDSRPAAP